MSIIRWLLLLCSLMFIASCAPTEKIKKTRLEAQAVAEEELPRIVAVLPFQNDTEERGIANQVRKAFYNHFSSKPYKDIEPSILDEKNCLSGKIYRQNCS